MIGEFDSGASPSMAWGFHDDVAVGELVTNGTYACRSSIFGVVEEENDDRENLLRRQTAAELISYEGIACLVEMGSGAHKEPCYEC